MSKKILSIIESISNEKSLNKNDIFKILENALEKSINKKSNINIKVLFDKNSGELLIFKILKIVDNVINKNKEISIKETIKKFPNNKINDNIKIKIDNFKFNRIISKKFKQIIFYEIKKIERISLIYSFKKLIGNIYTGIVKKILNNKIIFDIGYDFETILIDKHMLFNDKYKVGNKMKIILYDVKYNIFGLQLFVSRSHIFMLINLIKNNIFEFKKNIFNIKNISREPGIKSKIVFTNNNNYSNYINFEKKNKKKINFISNCLNNEEINFILWNSDIIKYVKNIFYPITIKNIDFNKNILNIYISKNNLLKLLGKNNLNIRLIHKIIDYKIEINTI